MKTGKKLTVFNIAAILVFFAIAGYSQDNLITKVKTIEKEFSNNIKYIDVNNNYGNINISYWNENKLKATVTIKVEAFEEEAAKSFIKKLLPVIKSKCDEMNVCDFGLRPKYFYTNDENHKKVFAPGSNKNQGIKQFSIDYDIKIPHSVNYIGVSNSFGNISIPDFSGYMQLTLANGNLKTGKLNLNDSTRIFEVRNSKVNIKSLENSNSIRIYSCKDVKIGSIKNTNLFSKFSDIQITDCSGLYIESKSDNITIDSLESLEGTGNFTDISISDLNKSIKFNNKSGTVNIEKIDPGFETISLDGQYNDYDLNLNGLEYTLNADLEFTDLESSDDIYPVQKREALISGQAAFEKKIGNGNTGSKVTLKCSNCNVELK